MENEGTERKRCLVEMAMGPCGRPVHKSEAECLMHSRDPGKSGAEFQIEFVRILEEAGEGVADFTWFVFPEVNYSQWVFKSRCQFRHATFTGRAIFFKATFAQEANFFGARFHQEATFFGATFKQRADFSTALMQQRAIFTEAKFLGPVEFRETVFPRGRGLDRVNVLGVPFRETEERRPMEEEPPLPGPVFTLASFEEPGHSIFYKTYLGQALFHNCDVSKLVFSVVEWRKRENGKNMVYDEEAPLDARFASALKPGANDPNERNNRLIAELYQQLIKNYDDRCDYWTAGDFHYGQMEMRRWHSPRRNRAVRGLRRNLGLVAWYKYASKYGESYVRPAIWLVGALFIFMLLFPIAGLENTELQSLGAATTARRFVLHPLMASELSYRYFHEFVTACPNGRWVGGVAFYGNSSMTALSVAGFQKELKYEPSYPWGRALALLELLLTSTLIALFLLAVRRQFRR